MCDLSTNTEYFDYALFGDSPNWEAPALISQNATSVKIARTTSDGFWSLTQTFTQVAGTSPSVKVAMVITNNTTIDRTVFLMRYADVEPDHLFTSSMGATSNSAFAWDQTVSANIGLRGNFGLMLQGVAPGSIPRTSARRGSFKTIRFGSSAAVPSVPELHCGNAGRVNGIACRDLRIGRAQEKLEDGHGELQGHVGPRFTVNRIEKLGDWL